MGEFSGYADKNPRGATSFWEELAKITNALRDGVYVSSDRVDTVLRQATRMYISYMQGKSKLSQIEFDTLISFLESLDINYGGHSGA